MHESIKAELARLTARLDRLENAPGSASADGQYWLIDKIARDGPQGGEVVYGGKVTLPTGENYLWQKHGAAKELFRLDWTGLDRVLMALGHPVRLTLLKAILLGQRTKADLEKLDGIGTTGQLYHHLKALEEAGWVRSLERGVYGVPGERVIPLLTILTAAMG
jgi:hypothetical protein